MSEAEAEAEAEAKAVYHERQRLQLCLLHALNNLFQEKDAFTRAQLDAIARQLLLDADPDSSSSSSSSSSSLMVLRRLFTPHHNALTGNYDVNVLMAALELKRHSLLWHDRRSPPASIDLSSPPLLGILLNSPVPRLAGLWTSRHWLALRCIQGRWYNLDSHLSAPFPFPDLPHLIAFLDHARARGAEIFLVLHHPSSH